MRHWLLFLYTVAIGIETGAGLFASLVVYRVWTASPEIVITWKPSMPYFMEEGWFFAYASPTTTLLAIAVLIAYLRARTPVRPWALGAAIAFIAIAASTFAYFLPMQDRMHGDAGARLPAAELAAMLQQFVSFNWIRQGVLVAGFLMAVHGLGVSYRGRNSEVGDPIAIPAAARSGAS